MKIKEFLGNRSAVEVVERDCTKAGQLVCDYFGEKVTVGWMMSSEERGAYWCDDYPECFANDLNFVQYAEKAVIKKVGKSKWVMKMYEVINRQPNLMNLDEDIYVIATADSKTRLAACLLCLAEVEG